MNPVAAGIVTGALVVAGKWADGKAPNMHNAIGVAGIAVGLAIIEQASSKLAEAFAWLIVLSVFIVYFPKIVKGTGLARKTGGAAPLGPIGSGLK
jgi:hypothetical protein